MYEVLVYVYERWWGGGACPDREQLSRKLTGAGFARAEIQQALSWLDGLDTAASAIEPSREASAPHAVWAAAPQSLRVYAACELEHLGAHGVACLRFLESAGALTAELREVVIDRALAMPGPLDLDDLKIILMMVYWRLDANPDVLILDELCDDTRGRVAH